MRHFYIILSLFLAALPARYITAGVIYRGILPGGVITASIDSPVAGQAVQGAVVIRGSTAVDGFKSYEIDYASSVDATQAWFIIQAGSDPIQDGILAVWNTNSLKDGDYNVRLQVYKVDGSLSEVAVNAVRVRNYTPIDNNTPTPPVIYVTLGPGTPTPTTIAPATLTPSLTPLPSTPTPLPINPAEITGPQVLSTFGKGALLSIGLFILLGAYAGVRLILNNRK